MAAAGLHALWGQAQLEPGELSYAVGYVDAMLGCARRPGLERKHRRGAAKVGWVAWKAPAEARQAGSPWGGIFGRATGTWRLTPSYGVHASVERACPWPRPW